MKAGSWRIQDYNKKSVALLLRRHDEVKDWVGGGTIEVHKLLHTAIVAPAV